MAMDFRTAATSSTIRTRPGLPLPVADVCDPIANLPLLVLNRKSESEGGPSPLLALHVDRSSVFRHDLVYDAQAQPRSLPWLLRREERVVDLVQHRLGDSAAGVRDRGDHVLATDAGGQAEDALALHRLHGVAEQVDEHLVDLDPAGPEPRHVLKLGDDLHLPKMRAPPDHLDRLTQPLAQVDCNHFFLPVRPGVTGKVAHDRGDVLRVADDVPGVLPDLGLVVFALDELGHGQDALSGIVDLMGHSRDQGAEAGQLLGLYEPFLGLFALRDVADDAAVEDPVLRLPSGQG